MLTGSACTDLGGAQIRAQPPEGGLSFSVWRKGSDIGIHTVEFERAGDRTMVRNAADFVVRFGPIALYRYTYRSSETWQAEVRKMAS